jgi:hypothetical protein
MMKRLMLILFLGIAVFLLAACAPAVVQPETATLQSPTLPLDTPTPTIEPSATPLPGMVLLIALPGSDVTTVQPLLSRLSESAGLKFETRGELNPDGLGEEIRVVILLAPPANLAELTAAAPQAQFVVVSPVDVPSSANISVIRQQPELQAFVGGFISVLLSTDWRAGGLLPSDGALAEPLKDAFINGGRYFCGICAPGWPLGMRYPQVVQLPAAGDSASFLEAAVSLYDTNKVEVYYLSSAAARPEVFQYLQEKDQFGKTILLVGEQAPPEDMRAQWAATVQFDTAASLDQLWPDLVAGKGGNILMAPLLLEDVNMDGLGEGRLRLINELLEEIQSGMVYPFSVPE